ncbi:transposase, partial [Microcoleus sp. MON2_D5]|uniref:transposase n=1 Tax=Microcoleus sp. MON2_D5 TaxID=2818833 RepID=UPI002FD4F1B1
EPCEVKVSCTVLKTSGIGDTLAEFNHFAITSDGSKFGNPKYFVKRQRNLKRKQQKLDRKKKGSQNRKKARLAVAKVHSKIARCREDSLARAIPQDS